MNIINVEMLDINDKQLICASGNFVMGFKGDNNTTQIKFNIPSKFLQSNAFAILTTPDRSHQYSIPLNDMSFIVTSSISKIVGDWSVVLMLMGDSNEENMPVCVSDIVIGTIKDSGIDVENMETLPTDTNMQILLNDLLSLKSELENTLLTCDPSSIQEIENKLDSIIENMGGIMGIDWESIESLSGLSSEVEEIKTGQVSITENTNTLLEDNVTLKNDHETILNAIDVVDDKIGEDDTTIFTHLNNIFSIGMGTQNMIQNGVINTLSTIIANTNNTNSLIGTVNDELAAL